MDKLGPDIKISFRAPKEFVQKFDTLAKIEGHTRSSLARLALKKLFAELQKDEQLLVELRKLPFVYRFSTEKNMKQYSISLRDDDYYLIRSIQEYTVRYDMSVSQIIRAGMAYMLKLYNAL